MQPYQAQSHPLEGKQLVIARDHKKPLGSSHTRMIAAALACGYRPPCGDWFTYLTETTPAGETKQTVTWLIDAGIHATFKLPGGGTETIPFGEFRDRFLSTDWIAANPDHPIAYLAAMTHHIGHLQRQIRTIAPQVCIRSGKRAAIYPADADPATIARAESHIAGA